MIFHWGNFGLFAISAIICWCTGALCALLNRKKASIVAISTGIAINLTYIIGFWIQSGRAPLATIGETRLWYSLFLMLTSLLIYVLWHYKWILSFGTLLSTIFTITNLTKPEIHSQGLAPALQSIWFIPHVTIYMLSYAFLGCSFLLAIFYFHKKEEKVLQHCDEIVRLGTMLFFIAMMIGSVWAKEAWGNFWTWDIKETWALITALIYTIYTHYRQYKSINNSLSALILIAGYIALQICWYGFKILPAAQTSLHWYK